MLLHCDLVYADGSAKFKMPFVPLGLSPEGASSFLLPRTTGVNQASELLFFGENFTAEVAKNRGIVTRVIDSDSLNAVVWERVQTLAALPPASVRATKEALRGPLRERTKKALLDEGEVFVERVRSEEAIEAFSAFMEKRTPDFSRFE